MRFSPLIIARPDQAQGSFLATGFGRPRGLAYLPGVFSRRSDSLASCPARSSPSPRCGAADIASRAPAPSSLSRHTCMAPCNFSYTNQSSARTSCPLRSLSPRSSWALGPRGLRESRSPLAAATGIVQVSKASRIHDQRSHERRTREPQPPRRLSSLRLRAPHKSWHEASALAHRRPGRTRPRSWSTPTKHELYLLKDAAKLEADAVRSLLPIFDKIVREERGRGRAVLLTAGGRSFLREAVPGLTPGGPTLLAHIEASYRLGELSAQGFRAWELSPK